MVFVGNDFRNNILFFTLYVIFTIFELIGWKGVSTGWLKIYSYHSSKESSEQVVKVSIKSSCFSLMKTYLNVATCSVFQKVITIYFSHVLILVMFQSSYLYFTFQLTFTNQSEDVNQQTVISLSRKYLSCNQTGRMFIEVWRKFLTISHQVSRELQELFKWFNSSWH